MKKIKYLSISIGIVILSVYFYKNFIYYKIPYNPISEYTSEALEGFYMTKNLPNGESVTSISHDMNVGNSIMDYFSELELIPIKESEAIEETPKTGNETYISGMFKFKQSKGIFISNIYTENPTVIYISSLIKRFKGEGYYKIVDSEFDYDYIYSLMNENEK